MNIVSKRRWFYLLSAIILVPSIISLIIPPSLFLEIEFTGGSTISVKFDEPVSESNVRNILNRLNHSEAIIQPAGNNEFFIRLSRLREGSSEQGIRSEREVIKEAFEVITPVARLDVASVSGVVASDTVRNAFIALVVASIAILFYITWAFRQVPNPFRYGVAAIFALIHDVLIVLGIFSILGKLIHLEVNAMFITGLLTIIGYSVNDTIVVFDRIRENVSLSPAERLERNINTSLLQTLGRSMNTSLTLLITVLALLLLGGESIRNFLLVLMIGLISGTYSSICVASQILVSWELGEIGRALRKIRLLPSKAES